VPLEIRPQNVAGREEEPVVCDAGVGCGHEFKLGVKGGEGEGPGVDDLAAVSVDDT